ncbi:alpha/beta fold hydrolase [Rhizobiaceae sp. 2RAB30]
MAQPIKSSTLKVPGASIYYETQGSGPTLLMIPGGPTDAGVFADLGKHLADRYTVVAYDPRGNSRSTFDGVPEEQRLDVHGDDAARLIEALGNGPAYVFGSSGGAQIGLDLTARHPSLVRMLAAHEPPCLLMLPDPSQEIAANEDILETYRGEGVGAATAKFMTMAGLADEGGQDGMPDMAGMPPDMIETFGRIEVNMDYFFAHGLMPLSLYHPDIDTLRNGRPRVVVGIGELSAGHMISDIGLALANKLGVEPVMFPGDHGGYGQHAETFAEVLHNTFST